MQISGFVLLIREVSGGQVMKTWTGLKDNDTGADGVFGTFDTGENDSIPTSGEPNFDRTDLNESDQIGLTGFKLNRIRVGAGGVGPTDDIIFYMDAKHVA